jgi:hypothetical protein
MEFNVDFQYRPKGAARPEDSPVLNGNGELLNLDYQNIALLPNIGDHVIFLRAASREKNGGYESYTQQIEGVVENRLFAYLSQDFVTVNIVVTDSEVEHNMLIKS